MLEASLYRRFGSPSRRQSAICRLEPLRKNQQRRKGASEAAHALAFLGVVFFVVALAAAAFLGAAAFFFVAVFAADSVALVLVTRPDFVLPRTRVTSFSTAGAAAGAAAADLRGLLALALGLAAAAVFLVVAGLAAAFLVAGAFSFLVVVFAFY
jgi:hypothetical protein